MSPIPTPRLAAAHAQKLKIPAPAKTLTPKRKHRKMLKDGTSEVWPEDVEQVFVEGLRQYWKSPYATFSSGRSRWRNAYLVEYLQKAGVTRTKKQVASHIQVLRNMWKGESEYSLVAGADEEQQALPPTSPTTDDEDSDAGSAPSPLTPSGSPFEDAFTAVHAAANPAQYRPTGGSSLRVVTTPPTARVKTEDVTPDLMAAPRAHGFPPSYAVPRSFAATPLASSSYSDQSLILAPDLISPSSYPLTPGAADTNPSLFPPQSYSRHRPSPTPSGSHPITATRSASNRLAGFTVWSDRAMICTVAPDTMRDSVRAAIRVSLQLPGPMTVVPAVSVAAPWSQATCTTSILHNGEAKYETSVTIPSPAATTPGAPVIACLPDPWLSNLRWMNYQPLVVNQRLLVDGVCLALVEYTITLSDSGVTGNVFAFRGYAADGSPRWSPMAMPPVALPGSGTGSGASTAPRLACPPTPTCAFDGGYHSASAIAGSSAFGPFC